MFAISIVLFKLTLYVYLCGLNYEYLILFYILSSFVEVFWKSVSVKCTKNSFQNIRTDVKIRIFPILIAFWSGFGISKQNWENPNKIMIVGRSVYFYGAKVQHPFPHRNPPPRPILKNILKHAKEDWGQCISFFNASIISPITTADIENLI